MFRNKRKKILFVIPSLAGGGAEMVLLNILMYLDRGKFIPYLVLFEGKGEYLSQVPADVIIYNLKKKNRFHFFKIILLLAYKIYPKIKPDIVVSFLEYTNLVTLIARKLSWIKPFVVITEHSHITISLKYKRMKKLRTLLVKKLYSQAYKIVLVSKGIAADLIKNYGIAQQKIQVICNGVDLKNIEQAIRESNISGIDENVLTIIACGRLTLQKNYPLLLRSFAKVQNQINSKILILGQGEERYSLEQLAHKLGIQEKVFFLGFQKNPFKYIAKSDIFVLSSSCEGFGNVIIEAMACGVPVISTRCPSGPDEIITEGVNGLLVPVGDVDALTNAILRLLKDKPLRKRLAEAGRKRAEDFRIEKMVAEYERVFEEVVSK